MMEKRAEPISCHLLGSKCFSSDRAQPHVSLSPSMDRGKKLSFSSPSMPRFVSELRTNLHMKPQHCLKGRRHFSSPVKILCWAQAHVGFRL